MGYHGRSLPGRRRSRCRAGRVVSPRAGSARHAHGAAVTAREQTTSHSGEPGSGALEPELWTIITGEYPPQSGGVSDYTCMLAHALAQDAEAVDVWCPGRDA